MSDIDDVLGGIYNPEIIAKQKASAQAAYEERVFKKIFTRFGLETEIPILLNQVKQTTGKPGLSMVLFNNTLPSFPVLLVANTIGYIHETRIPDLFNDIAKGKIVSAWADAADNAGLDKPIGVIFDFPGVKGKQLVCHNWDVEVDDFETRIRARVGTEGGQVLWIERLEAFLNNVATVWVK